mgnify:CR=1 FL=1
MAADPRFTQAQAAFRGGQFTAALVLIDARAPERFRGESLEFGGCHLFVQKREAGELHEHRNEHGVLISLAGNAESGPGGFWR